jgi:hypothetical protein
MTDVSHMQETIARAALPARAIVCAGGVDTEYIRAGRGEPLVLVVAQLDSAEVAASIAALARNYLVFAAAPALQELAKVASWQADFLEGLGVASAHLMLHASAASSYINGDSQNA